MPVTIRQVAERLNLSVTTVSRALMGYDDVADATRERVQSVALEMGYQPSHAARTLRRQRTETLALVLPTGSPRFSDPFFSNFIAGVGDEASHQHHDLLVSMASPGPQEEATYRRLVQSRRVDGFVLVRTRISDWRVECLLEEGVPFVAFGRSQTGAGSPFVGVDGRAGMRALVAHLVELGHRRIAFISAPPELTLAQDRLTGYREGLQAAGLPFNEGWVIGETLRQQGGYAAAQELLQLSPRPTAIIGVNDRSALGALRAARELGLEVGVDIALAGFDGTEASAQSHPRLTTIRQPVYDIGRRVTRMLLTLVDGQPLAESQFLLEPELIVRPSTDPRASAERDGRPHLPSGLSAAGAKEEHRRRTE